MKIIRIKLYRAISVLCIAMLVGVAGTMPANARDTDIYFSNPNSQASQVKPNVLLILDTSGSMNTTVSGTGKSRLNNMKDALNVILDNTNNVKMGIMRFSGDPGGPVLFPVADLDANAADIEGTGSVTVQSAIAQGTDDAEQNVATGSVSTSSAGLELVEDGGATQVVGLRFQNANIPKGVTITSAVIKFNTKSAASGSTDLVFQGEASDNAATYTTAASNISTRTPTTASVPWSGVPSWSTVNNDETSPDLKSIVQEIVGRTNWCGGNAMAIMISGTGQRIAKSYEDDPSMAPTLIVTYDPSTIPVGGGCVKASVQAQVSSTNDDADERSNGTMSVNRSTLPLTASTARNYTTGVRFRNIAIPNNATIVSAELEFTVQNQSNNTATNLTIRGHDTDDAGQFTTSNNNITGRNTTSANVSWSSVPSVAVGGKLISPDLTTIVDEIVSRPGWASGNDMAFIITGNGGIRTAQSFDGDAALAPVLRITYQTNATATTSNNITVRQRLKDIVSQMLASGSTPIVDSLYEGGLYYRGQNVLYGLQRGNSFQSSTTRRYTRVSHPATYTGGSGVYRASGCTDTDLNATACTTEQIQGTPTYISPFTAGCQPNHIVILTDGDPTANNSVTQIQTLIGKNCATTAISDAKCTNELVTYYKNTDLSGLADTQNIITHAIGFNTDGDPAYLQAMATAGGGNFKTASTASELQGVFEDILNSVLKIPTAFVSPSLSVNAFNKLFNSDEVYFSLFTPDTTVGWAGNVKKFKLCSNTSGPGCTYGEVVDRNNEAAINPTNSKILGTADSYWGIADDGAEIKEGGAGEKIPVHTARNVYTYTGSDDLPASPVDLSGTAHVVNTTNVTKAMLGNGSMLDATHTAIINWMRGQNTESETFPADTVVASGNRWAFADALHSRPVTVTYGYHATTKVPVTKILVGTNDGALRMINAENGTEQWAVYIPDFLSMQQQLQDNGNGEHFGGLDGSPTVWVIDNNKNGKIEPAGPENDKVYLYIGERRGGRNIYAFDLTPASTLSDPTSTSDVAPKYLWRIRGGTTGFAALGQTWSKPLLTKIRVRGATAGTSVLKDVLIFGGGYDPAQDDVMPSGADSLGNAIYIVDPLNGSLVWSAGATGSGAAKELSAMNYSIASDIAAVDTDGDGAVDRLYASDTRGQIFRIDLSGQIYPSGADATEKNGGSSGYVFADVGCTGGVRVDISNPAKNHCADTPKYERRKFFYSPDVAQVRDPVYSSVTDYDLVSIESGDREDPLDKITSTLSVEAVHNRIYAFRDVNTNTGAPASTPAILTDSDLYNATANDLQDPAGSSYAGALTAIKAAKGWYIDLKNSSSPNWVGEKGLAKTTVFDGILYATTFTPNATTSTDGCEDPAEGIGKLYAMNYLNGTAVNDLNGDGTIDRFITVGKGIPSEIVIVIRESGVTALVGTSGGATTPPVDSELPRYPTYWYNH